MHRKLKTKKIKLLNHSCVFCVPLLSLSGCVSTYGFTSYLTTDAKNSSQTLSFPVEGIGILSLRQRLLWEAAPAVVIFVAREFLQGNSNQKVRWDSELWRSFGPTAWQLFYKRKLQELQDGPGQSAIMSESKNERSSVHKNWWLFNLLFFYSLCCMPINKESSLRKYLKNQE